MFDYSRMMGLFFEPDEKICLIFDNEHYDKLREIPEFSKKYPKSANGKINRYGSLAGKLEYPDMPYARE